MDILKEVKQKKDAEFDKNPDVWGHLQKIPKTFGNEFLDFIDRIKLPECYDPKKEELDQVVKLMDWVLDMALIV